MDDKQKSNKEAMSLLKILDTLLTWDLIIGFAVTIILILISWLIYGDAFLEVLFRPIS